jgi:hypothetical protein
MRFRKLRIAWSLFWGLAALLLIVLWARSYSYLDIVKGPWLSGRAFQVASTTGRFLVTRFQLTKGDHFGWVRSTQSQVDDNFNSDPKITYLKNQLDMMRLAEQHGSEPDEKRYSLMIEDMNRKIAALRVSYANQFSTRATWRVPIWCVVISAATLAAVPWLPNRFSLRTLLIATSLVALVLGLVVYVTRQ